MGVSVRVEDCAFDDSRYDELASHFKPAEPDADWARGKMLWIWRQCTKENSRTLSQFQVKLVLGEGGVDALVASNLAELCDDGRVRIKGTEGRIEWFQNLKKGSKAGGRSRAKTARRGANGRML